MDLATGQFIVSYHPDQYFTPASNTKLFTFYAGLKLLPKKIPALHYVQRGDSLIFWGTGDPTALHPVLKSQLVYQFLKTAPQKLYFSAANFQDNHFGEGWAWDDYNSSYQPEKSPLPLYGNVLRLQQTNGKLRLSPRYFGRSALPGSPRQPADRAIHTNDFVYNPKTLADEQLPYRTSPALTATLLADTLGKPVTLLNRPLAATPELKTLEGIEADTLYRLMLQESDNFLAEQILLLCASRLPERGYALNTEKAIDYATRNLLATLTDKPRWVDGSGLSRYNLFTPRSYVQLLANLYAEVATDEAGEARLFSLLPQPGLSGTLRNVKVYPATLYAKTGSLSNNHNLSGYLVTKSGKRLAFSFQNNHYMIPIGQIREEMGKVLTEIYEKY
jgi:serine-type D-Ala-D-Ala carboxypeptidase/endopeptidase (penicillin-binding protein 4)